VRVESILLADSATDNGDGTFSLDRAGWDHVLVDGFPAEINSNILLVLGAESEADVCDVMLEVSDDHGILGVSRGPLVSPVVALPIVEGIPYKCWIGTSITAMASGPTVARIRVLESDETEIGSTAFAIVEAIPDVPPLT
jgi:hypothetical protein